MHHHTLDQIADVATVQPVPELDARTLRRQRLHRFADLLAAHTGPVRLLSRLEYLPAPQRHAMRGDISPISVAYADAEFRRQGLAGDTVGDAMGFFGLSERQAHTLFCDCHYDSSSEPPAIARRVRGVANRLSLRECWEKTVAYFSRA